MHAEYPEEMARLAVSAHWHAYSNGGNNAAGMSAFEREYGARSTKATLLYIGGGLPIETVEIDLKTGEGEVL
jgi:hypothetical protein